MQVLTDLVRIFLKKMEKKSIEDRQRRGGEEKREHRHSGGGSV
jgi:hypothetical protein